MSNTSNKKSEEKIIYGFYSLKQYTHNKKLIYYLNMNDEVVQVTSVSKEDTIANFDDFIRLGKLKRHIPNFYIENYGYKYENFKDKMLENDAS
tara:strand:- start:139 stop:417 length:279 start_codon:yes stop_codon:yes gene_type:complete